MPTRRHFVESLVAAGAAVPALTNDGLDRLRGLARPVTGRAPADDRRDEGGLATGHAPRQPAQPVEPVIREGRNRGPCGDQRLDEVPACRHRLHPPRSARRSSTP